ncbi:MAG TPA: STY0301 family protein [Burkholderiaceae bacterium]
MTPFHAPRLAALLVCASSLAQAAAGVPPSSAGTELHCPATLAQAPVAEGLPNGWVLHGAPAELHVQRATFYDGDPVGLGTLAPDTTRRSGLTETSTWSFATSDSARVWLGCLYGGATAIVARPLPAGLHQCTTVLRLTPLGDPSEPLSVRCR